jgi:hypothetical protein
LAFSGRGSTFTSSASDSGLGMGEMIDRINIAYSADVARSAAYACDAHRTGAVDSRDGRTAAFLKSVESRSSFGTETLNGSCARAAR